MSCYVLQILVNNRQVILSVSYTHLDVYKRQYQGLLIKKNCEVKNGKTIEFITKIKMCNEKEKCIIVRQEIVSLRNEAYCN